VLVDGRAISAGTEMLRDVCIIGAGPAGISIANRLAGSGLSVALVEGGGFEPSVRNQGLYQGENVGHPYFRLDGSRFRMLGGSGNVWGGWSRPLDSLDFDARPDLGCPGWPISATELDRYNVETARLLKLPSAHFDVGYWAARLPGPIPLEDSEFENGIFQYSVVRDFGHEYRSQLADSTDITLLMNANVTQLLMDPGTERVGGVQARALGRPAFSVKAKIIVLATGGLENPRLLLASHHDRPAGIGNDYDSVGRYFMEHLHAPVGHLAAYGRGIRDNFYDVLESGGNRTRGVILPTQAARLAHELPGCSIALNDNGYGFNLAIGMRPPRVTVLPLRAMRAMGGRRVAPVIRHVKPVLSSAISVKVRRDARRAAHAARQVAAQTGSPVREGELRSIYLRAEQIACWDSRVTLTKDVDELGMPRIALDWKVSAGDTNVIESWLDIFAESAERQNFGRVYKMAPEEWLGHIDGGPHHMGTTRMSAGPRDGVVDRNCRVHSVKNLYVAGSSTFATGGYTNPTFTVLALALRLADHIRDELTRPVVAGSSPDRGDLVEH
jgi:choline dehydrogenase-like flavoprotein